MKDTKVHYKEADVKYLTNIKGWVSSSGRYWGEDEHMARYDSCDEMDCATEECLNTCDKGRRYCQECSHQRAVDKWEAAKKQPVTGEDEFYYSDELNDYFQCWEDIEEYCEDHVTEAKDLLLYHCERESPPQVDIDWLYEDITPDGLYSSDMVNAEIEELVDKLNDALSRHPVNCFNPTKIAVEIVE